jgi:fructuronate reductase
VFPERPDAVSDTAPPRLSNATLEALPKNVERPGYDRAAVTTGVVHLGIGAFHRAHQAAVFDALIRGGDTRWGVRGASLRSPGVRDQMNPQDGLYAMTVRDGHSEQVRILGAVKDVLVAPEDPAALVEALASADTHLATLTVTEKGYRLDPATGTLLEDDAEVAADLADLSRPRTAPGFLTAALALRKARGLKPFTAISCDNLPHNGERLRAAVLAMAGRHDPRLRDWIGTEGAFPQTMVDRIVPATTPEDIVALTARLGVADLAMVKTEPFLQWVVEDRFAGPRPDLEAAGVQVATAVAPWEEAKLRLLNGAHSAIAYLGGLAGSTFVHEVTALPVARRFVERLWDESAATLTPPPGLNVSAYRQALMARFDNPSLNHRTRQIAMDGSQKLPQRLLAPMAVRVQRGQPFEAQALAVAAWMRWQGGRDDAGQSFSVDDPLAAVTRRAWDSASDASGRVAALMAIEAIFPPVLAQSEPVRAALTQALGWLDQLGADGALAAFEAA